MSRDGKASSGKTHDQPHQSHRHFPLVVERHFLVCADLFRGKKKKKTNAKQYRYNFHGEVVPLWEFLHTRACRQLTGTPLSALLP